jgi:hypothetical protein
MIKSILSKWFNPLLILIAFVIILITGNTVVYSQRQMLYDLSGEWYSTSDSSYKVTIDGSGKNYYYDGTNGDYRHSGILSWDGKNYSGPVMDVPGYCCGNVGYIWMLAIDENTIRTRSEWRKPNQNDPFLVTDWQTLKRNTQATPFRKEMATMSACRGEVIIERAGKRFKAQRGTKVQYKDTIITGKRGWCVFESYNVLGERETLMSMTPNAMCRVDCFYERVAERRKAREKEQSKLTVRLTEIIKGFVRILDESWEKYISGEPVRVRTKNAVLGPRGTDFIYGVDPDKNRDLIYVHEGSVEVTGNVSGSAIVNASEQVEVKNGIVQRVKSMDNSAWNRMSADFLMPEPERGSGSLGALVQEVTQAVAQEAGLRQPRGALVLKVADDSPAERAGILPGDIILEFDRHTIHTIKDLIALVQETPPGKRVKVVLWRNRTQKTVEVQIAASATEPPRPESTCQLVISGALDDHYNSNGNYDLSIAVNGQTLFNDTAQKVFEHGRPYGKRFDNWSTLPLDLPGDIKKGQKLSVQFKHSGSQKQEWIAVDCMELVCCSEKKRYEIGGYANYGARDGAAGIIYGQGSNGWTIQR